jgi:hypothetical protein
MSFNQTIKNNQSLYFKFLKDNLLMNKDVYLNSYSLKDRNLKESELKDLKKYEELLGRKIKNVSQFNEADANHFKDIETYMKFLHEKTLSYREELTSNLNNRINHIESKKIEVKGKINEILQKLNHLSGFTETYRFVFKEDFYNLFNISKSLINLPSMEIDVESNIATLPISVKTLHKVKNIIISSDSEGIPGSAKSGQNKMIYSLIDSNPNTFFEFFKLNSGPAKLVLNFRFEKNTVVNQIKIKRAFSSASNSLEIEDVLFNKKNSRSIKRLIDPSLQSMNISPSKNGELTITHLPIECDSLTLVLKSKEYTTTAEGLKIFNISLEKVEFYSIEYQDEGEFNSTRIVTPENLFVLNSETKIFPSESISYEETLSVSMDNGGQRNLMPYYRNRTKDLIIPAKQNFLNYVYGLKRNIEATSSSEEISNEDYFVNSTSLLKTVNKKISPINYSINEESCNETLRVVQGEIFRRSSNKEKAIVLGRATLEGINKITIPFSLASFKIEEEDVILYGSNKKLTRVETENEVTDEEKFFIDYKENLIVVFLNIRKSVSLKMLLKPYSGSIIYKNEGYYIELKEPFEYDKRLIKVKTFTTDDEKYEVIVPNETSKVFLPDENITEIEVVEEAETNWKQLTLDVDYSIKSLNGGIVHLNETENQIKINYKKENVKTLNKNEFEIWGNKNEVKGLFLYPEHVSFNDHEGEVGKGIKQRNIEGVSNIIEGTLKFSPGPVARAYKEVAFIDGYTEFLNIKKMKKDFIPKIEWSSEGDSEFVLFTADKIPYKLSSYSESIKIYNKIGKELDSELLDQVPENEIIFKLNKPEEDIKAYAEGYYIEYYYLNNKTDDTYKYSVDYKNGIIYFSNLTEVEDSRFRCKYGNIKVEYNLYHEIKEFKFEKKNGIVSVETEEFGTGNNKIKFFWHEVENKTSLKGLEKFYSPILYSLKIGMN